MLLINVAIFSVLYGAIQMLQFKQIQKKFNQEKATEPGSESLLHDANGNNYGTNAATDAQDPTASANQASEQPSDPEPVHEVIEVEIE